MLIKKSYKLIEFGNKEHNIILLYLIGFFAFAMTFISSFSKNCAKLSFDQIMQKNVKSSLRRVAWFVRRSWLRVNLIDDGNFDFTEDLNTQEVYVVETFLLSRENKICKHIYLAENLFLLSYKLHDYSKKNNLKTLRLLVHEFEQLSNTLLEYILNNYNNIDNKLDYTKINQIKNEENLDFVKQAKNILSVFAKYISKDIYPWYIISGTFLGLHRENGFLKHDIDIDIGINYEDIKDINQFLKDLKKLPNISVKNIIHMPKINIKSDEITYDDRLGIIKLVDITGIQIDVFIHYKEGDKIIHGSKIHQWENSSFSLKTDMLEGVEVYCPDNPEIYLNENYGDWKTPIKEFSCSTGTPNLTVAQNFFSIAFFLRRLVDITNGKETKTSFIQVLNMLKEQKVIVDNKINIPFMEVK
ncbi:hypothetical protein [Arcobacter sp. FWKO B]|uniref:hypothetical protein n=1 Tax=Arcobacter sp. FWKO B TaxID=2593672 RepID=UPI0018A5158E|nr:hypothetical protein [Arcobacter sp. FWKO B]QOG11266.1 hypothetical protein FWKOB_00530 [Arcobacter sp. FWKO B]